MAAPSSKLTPFERMIFASAVLIAVIVLTLRFGTAATLWVLHHLR